MFGKGLNLFFIVILSTNSLNSVEEILVLTMSIFIAVSLFSVFDTSFLDNFFSSFKIFSLLLFSSKRTCLANSFSSLILLFSSKRTCLANSFSSLILLFSSKRTCLANSFSSLILLFSSSYSLFS